MHPTLLEYGPLVLHSYGLMLAIGGLVAVWRAAVASKRYGIPDARVVDAGIIVILAGLVGARIGYVLLTWDEFAGDPVSIIAVWDGGLTYYGGLIAGALAGVVWARLAKVNVADFADLVAPSLALGYGIARIGCFLNGCCYGSECALPWAVRFHQDGGDVLTAPSHPVQIYSSLGSLIIFFLLTRLEKRGLPPGTVFGCWLILASMLRFFMEYFRAGVTGDYLWGGLTEAQAASLVLLLGGAVIVALAGRARGTGRRDANAV